MTSYIKRLIRSHIPEPVHRLWRRHRFLAEQRRVRGRPLDEVFAEIYESSAWASPGEKQRYHSGPGSEPAMTAEYEDYVIAHISANPAIGTWVDIGCGDFQVARRILARVPRSVRYLGCDIAANVVAYNAAEFGRNDVEFRALDVTRDLLPQGDLVTVREVFQHLSNDAIHHALTNLRRNFRYAIVTEAVPDKMQVPNVDLVSGYRTRDGHNSAVCLDQPPFNLKIRDERTLARIGNETLKTMIVEL